MKKIKPDVVLFFVVIGFLWVSDAKSATINAASCSRTDVQTAMNSAFSGDTVVVPAGQCNWTSAVSIKTGVTLQGAGIGKTIISGVGPTLNSNSRLTGFEFSTNVLPTVTTNATSWRIDHNKLQQSPCSIWLDLIFTCETTNSHFIGLIDNNQINGGHIRLFPCTLTYSHYLWAEGHGYGPYNDHTIGKLYIEGNTIDNTACGGGAAQRIIDTRGSGRYVVRFNTITEAYMEFHGPRQEEWTRGGQYYEIYRNTMTNGGAINIQFSNIRGGTGVIFDNTTTSPLISGEWNLNYERCNPPAHGTQCLPGDSFDTTPHPFTGTSVLCRDWFAGKDAFLGGPSDVGDQKSQPAYWWGNTLNGGTWAVGLDTACIGQRAEFRDYYVDSGQGISGGSSIVGGGVTVGLYANMPATCTPREAYWATDVGSWNNGGAGGQGLLYVCTAPNTWTLYYTPQTYPHPLTQTGGNRPQPPKKLRIMP